MGLSLADPSRRVQIPANGGSYPRWRRDGRALFFVGADRTVKVVEADERSGRFSAPRSLFDAYAADAGGNPVVYDVSADGQRFLMARPQSATQRPIMHVLLNWTSLLTGARR
ncbi:MAG: hypothetical protein U0Q12_19275 [Vicinamibacterales bacterium]